MCVGSRCDIQEEPEDEDGIVRATYEKTGTKIMYVINNQKIKSSTGTVWLYINAALNVNDSGGCEPCRHLLQEGVAAQ